jgi:hypothetical protein
MPASGRVGRVTYRIPKIGYALFYVHGPLGRVAFVIVPAILFCFFELWLIWRPRREDEGPAPAAPELAPNPIPAAERLPDGEPDPLPLGVPDFAELPAPRAEDWVR